MRLIVNLPVSLEVGFGAGWRKQVRWKLTLDFAALGE